MINDYLFEKYSILNDMAQRYRQKAHFITISCIPIHPIYEFSTFFGIRYDPLDGLVLYGSAKRKDDPDNRHSIQQLPIVEFESNSMKDILEYNNTYMSLCEEMFKAADIINEKYSNRKIRYIDDPSKEDTIVSFTFGPSGMTYVLKSGKLGTRLRGIELVDDND